MNMKYICLLFIWNNGMKAIRNRSHTSFKWAHNPIAMRLKWKNGKEDRIHFYIIHTSFI